MLPPAVARSSLTAEQYCDILPVLWMTSPGKMDEEYILHVFFVSGSFVQLCENVTSSTKPEVLVHNYYIAVRGGPSHGHSNVYRKFGEIWTCGL